MGRTLGSRNKHQKISPLQVEYINWLFSQPRVPAKKKDWCQEHDISYQATLQWEKNPVFKDYYESKLEELYKRYEGNVLEFFGEEALKHFKASDLFLRTIDRRRMKSVTEGGHGVIIAINQEWLGEDIEDEDLEDDGLGDTPED